jgi:lipopolysaccharide/colanic/teichoic acid biosynthesis glycosyltransferase
MFADTQTTVEPPANPAANGKGRADLASPRPPRGAGEHCPPLPPSRVAQRLVVPVTWYATCKRIIDVAGALVLLVVAVPVIALAALLVRLTSRGPAFYSQTRVGRGGRPFTIYKIRSMVHNAEKVSGAQWCRPGDKRVMPIGKLLRRTHLDELPQLWNILKGEMSLIGPRPERPEFVPQLEAALPRYRERLLVLPGVSGLAQVHLGPDTDLASVERKLAYDLYYIKNQGLWTDLRILVATVFHVFQPFVVSRWIFPLSPCAAAEAVNGRGRGAV